MPTFGFAFLLVLSFAIVLRLWLGVRNISHVQAHRNAVPAQFSGDVSLDAHQRAADYTSAKTRLALLSIVIDTALVVWLTFGGGVQRMYEAASSWFDGEIARGLALIALVSIVTTLVELPLGLYRTFRIEERFGFNKMTASSTGSISRKSGARRSVRPAAGCVRAVAHAGRRRILVAVRVVRVGRVQPDHAGGVSDMDRAAVQPVLADAGSGSQTTRRTAPSPLRLQSKRPDGDGRLTPQQSWQRLFHRVSANPSASSSSIRCFRGLTPPEVEAVLAHELGHFKLRHVVKRIVWIFLGSLVFLWLLDFVMQQDWFYAGLNVEARSTAIALVLFFLVVPSFTFLLQPLLSSYSRKHEFEADHYAAQNASARDLVSALVKLYKDNASTLTPDPLHSAFYDSHPPALARIARLQEARQGV